MEKLQQTISFKSFLHQSGDNVEIRRFALGGKDASFKALQDKLNQLYEDNLQQKGYLIHWKDEDGDEVMISSDDELVEAIAKQKESDLLRLFIRKFKDGAKRGDDSNLHKRVTCDGCEGDIRGFRYKCCQCPDYDLCSTCEHKKEHSAHLMIRIPTPMHRPHGFGPHGFFPFWMPGRGRRFHCRRNRNWPHGGCPAASNDSEQPSTSQEGGAEGPNVIPEILDQFWKLVGKFSPAAAGAATNQNQGGGSEQQQQMPNPEEYLKTVGETVAAFLDPLGIDVTVDVEHNGKTSHCGEENQDRTTTEDKETGNASQTGTQDNSNNEKSNEKTEEMTAMETLTQLLNLNATINSEDQQDQAPMETADWTYVDVTPEGIPENTEIKTVETGAEASSTTPAQASHPDPVIVEGLQQMMSMGYDNENHWLEKLLEVSGGKVDRALDNISLLHDKNNDVAATLLVSLVEKCNGNIAQLSQMLQSMKKFC